MRAPTYAGACLLAAFAVGTLAGCPSNNDSNPSVLWLAPDGSEVRVHLVDTEPPPF